MVSAREAVCFDHARRVGRHFTLTLILVARTRSGRAYPLPKIQENNTAEIMEVVLNDARDSYAEEIVVELQSESPEQMEENISRIVGWVEAWKKNNDDDDE